MSKTVRFSRKEISRKFQFSGFSLKGDALTVFERELLCNRIFNYDSLDDFVKDVVNVLSFEISLDFAIIDVEAAENIIKNLKSKQKPQLTEENESRLIIKNVNFDSEAKQRNNSLHYNQLFSVLNEFLQSLSNFKSELTNIEKIITTNRASVDCIVLGFIRKNTRKITGYLLEDSSGDVPIELGDDNSYQHPVIFENSFVLVEGVYHNEEDILIANKIGYPPPQIHLKSDTVVTVRSMPRMFVVVREIHLDDENTFKKLRILFTGYNEIDTCPDAFIFIGPFCLEEQHFTEVLYFKALMRKLFELISSFAHLSEQSHFIFVPHSECKEKNLIKEPLPQEVIPEEVNSKLSIHLATNPVHIFIGNKHICIHTGDYLKNIRQKMLHNTTTNREEYITAVVKVILSNAHLTPGSHKSLLNPLSLWSLPNVLLFSDDYIPSEFRTQVITTTIVNAGSFSRDYFKFKVLYADTDTIENSQIP